MRKMMFLVPLLALLILLSIAPALAEPTSGQKVTAKYIFASRPEVRSLGESKMTDGGIIVFKGHTEFNSANFLFIGSNSIPLSVFAIQVGSGSWNSKTRTMIFNGDVVWYISSEGSPDGFSGNMQTIFFDFDFLGTHTWVSMQVHGVLQGFGAYSGQTLMLSYDGLSSPILPGYCLKG